MDEALPALAYKALMDEVTQAKSAKTLIMLDAKIARQIYDAEMN